MELGIRNSLGIPNLGCGDDCTAVEMYQTYQTISLKWVNFMEYKLYLHKAIRNSSWDNEVLLGRVRPCMDFQDHVLGFC